jgi:hypothetical protein
MPLRSDRGQTDLRFNDQVSQGLRLCGENLYLAVSFRIEYTLKMCFLFELVHKYTNTVYKCPEIQENSQTKNVYKIKDQRTEDRAA